MSVMVSIAGRVQPKDAEMRYSDKGTAIVNFNIPKEDKDKYTAWYKCVIFGAYAEKMVQYLKKGTSLTVHGRLTPKEYEKSDGTKGYSLEVVVIDIELQGKPEPHQEEATAEPAF